MKVHICCLGKPFEFRRIMTAAVANLITSILLGKQYDYEDPHFIKLLSLAAENAMLFGSPEVQVMIIHLKSIRSSFNG